MPISPAFRPNAPRIASTAPLITAVSKPTRKPPSAAAAAITTTRKVACCSASAEVSVIAIVCSTPDVEVPPILRRHRRRLDLNTYVPCTAPSADATASRQPHATPELTPAAATTRRDGLPDRESSRSDRTRRPRAARPPRPQPRAAGPAAYRDRPRGS